MDYPVIMLGPVIALLLGVAIAVSLWRIGVALEAMQESLQDIERHLRDRDRSAGEPRRAPHP